MELYVCGWLLRAKIQPPAGLIDVLLLSVVVTGCKTGASALVDLHPAIASEATKNVVRVRSINYRVARFA